MSPADPIPNTDKAHCFDCHYPLRGLTSTRCPECGRPFDPAKPETMNFGRRMPAIAKIVLRPTGRWMIAVCVGLTVVSALPWLLPGERTAVIGLIGWGMAGLFLYGRAVSRRAIVRAFGQPTFHVGADAKIKSRCGWLFVLTASLLSGVVDCAVFVVFSPILERDVRKLYFETPVIRAPGYSRTLAERIYDVSVSAHDVTFHRDSGNVRFFRLSPSVISWTVKPDDPDYGAGGFAVFNHWRFYWE